MSLDLSGLNLSNYYPSTFTPASAKSNNASSSSSSSTDSTETESTDAASSSVTSLADLKNSINSNLVSSMSSLLPSTSSSGGGTVVGGDLLTQWSMLGANGKALKAAIRAEERGYLRDKDGPAFQSQADRLYDAKERSFTVEDVLKSMGRESAIPKEGDGTATDTASDTDSGVGGTVDTTA